MMMMKHFTLALLLIGSLCGPTLAQDESPTLAWLFNDELWIAVDDTAASIATGALDAALAPDGQHIAYTTTDAELIIADISSGNTLASLSSQDELVYSSPVWVSNSTILFNTIELRTPGFRNREDLVQLSLDGDLTELASPGAGGEITVSPDRHYIALTQAGEYGDKPGIIEILDLGTGERVGNPFTFDAVATGSEISWRPQISWDQDGTTIGFAIPVADALYLTDTRPSAEICRQSIGEPPVCIEQPMDHTARHVWNSDLTLVAFTTGDGDNRRQLVLGPFDGTLRQLDPLDTWPEPVLWLDDDTLVFREYLRDGQFQTISLSSGEVVAWQPDGQRVLEVQCLDQSRLALATGSLAEVSVGIFTGNTFTAIVTLQNGVVRFVQG